MNRTARRVFCVACAGIALAGVRALAASPPPAPAGVPSAEQVRFFEAKIRPVLLTKCGACHGAGKQLAGLRLDTRDGLLRGGTSGPAFVAGDPSKSLLIRAVNHDGRRMPPSGKLASAEIRDLTEWVRQGAPWPAGETGGRGAAGRRLSVAEWKQQVRTSPELRRRYWALLPLRTPPIPRVSASGWDANPVDAFILARLRSARLSPAPEADRTSLVRRLYANLIGLPPTPEEVEAFLGDTAPGAYERLVDRLLASPRHGEKWARHWLDLVRYADSDGYRIDDYRPHAWRYRDYVIDTFNQDRPYDRFVQEQLAGDELFPGDPRALIATGYLRHGIYEYNNRDVRGQWTTILNDLTDTTADVFLAMGVQCARCHDHKFDPIPQKDYYRLQAFFAPILPREDLVAATPDEVARHRAAQAPWEERTADLRRQIAEIEARYRAGAAKDAVEKFPPEIQEMIRKPPARRTPLEHQLAELAYRQVYYEYDRLERHLKGDDKERWLALNKQLRVFDRERPTELPVAFAATDAGPEAPPVRISKRTEPVAPGFLSVLEEGPARIDPVPGKATTGRRAALARWLTRPDNPLTARVIVNRIWQHHFGRGLAANASDFGRLGEPPSHPELLDYLASRFVAPVDTGGLGWSLKRLHRLIVTSAAYRQATRHPQESRYGKLDPENRLYWRGSTRRLEAEQIRDALLAVTGELDLKAGGPGVLPAEPRRSIYTRVMRNSREPLLEVFDLPLFFNSTAGRDTTTTPVQSLLLFNSQAMLALSGKLAARLEREGEGNPDRIVRRAYRLAYGRPPSTEEQAAAQRFLAEQAARVDPALSGSARAAFLHERMPHRDGQAALLAPEGPQTSFTILGSRMMPVGDFTIEAFILPRSIYDTGAVRTIASRWSGDARAPGWAFGVTGKQSRRKPQTLVIQLFGRRLDGTAGEEAIFSDQHIQIGKPYYAAASVRLAREGREGEVTFYLKDLSNDDEPLLSARVPHRSVGPLESEAPLLLGARAQGGHFDGLLDDVRLSRAALGPGELLFTVEGVQESTVGYWQFEPRPHHVFRDATGNGLDIRPGGGMRSGASPDRAALADFCQALLNSNEFLYVD